MCCGLWMVGEAGVDWLGLVAGVKFFWFLFGVLGGLVGWWWCGVVRWVGGAMNGTRTGWVSLGCAALVGWQVGGFVGLEGDESRPCVRDARHAPCPSSSFHTRNSRFISIYFELFRFISIYSIYVELVVIARKSPGTPWLIVLTTPFWRNLQPIRRSRRFFGLGTCVGTEPSVDLLRGRLLG